MHDYLILIQHSPEVWPESYPHPLLHLSKMESARPPPDSEVSQNLWEYCSGICILQAQQVIIMHSKFNYHFFQPDAQITFSFSQLPGNSLQD